MKSSSARRCSLLFATSLLSFGVLSANSVAQEESPPPREKAKVSVDISATKFVVQGKKVSAEGPVEARVVRSDGTTETINKQVDLRVKATNKCRVLELRLAKLYLNLLGLEVRTSEINLEVTGTPDRALGKLFCELSKGIKLNKGALARKTADSLNKALDSRPLPIVSFSAPVRAQEAPPQRASARPTSRQDEEVPPVPPGSCEVLNLLLGPLHLDLLGLVVDLYGPSTSQAVRVLVTANPNGGAVGAALCEVAGEPSP